MRYLTTRVTSNPGLPIAITSGEKPSREKITDDIRAEVGTRLNEATLGKVVRNASSSWTQSGHLRGRARKFRELVRPTPLSTAYAVLLGYTQNNLRPVNQLIVYPTGRLTSPFIGGAATSRGESVRPDWPPLRSCGGRVACRNRPVDRATGTILGSTFLVDSHSDRLRQAVHRFAFSNTGVK